MPTLEELRETYFSDRPVTQIFCGEPPEAHIMRRVLDEVALPTIDPNLDTGIQMTIAAGSYPILILSYDEFPFDRHVSEAAMRDYLRDLTRRPDPRIFASIGRQGVHVAIVHRFLLHIGLRPCKLQDVGQDLKFYFAAQPGERLVIATIGREPVPGVAMES